MLKGLKFEDVIYQTAKSKIIKLSLMEKTESWYIKQYEEIRKNHYRYNSNWFEKEAKRDRCRSKSNSTNIICWTIKKY